MAVSGKVSLEVVARAQENIRAVLRQSNAAIRASSNELERANRSQTRLGTTIDGVKGKVVSLHGAMTAMGATVALVAARQVFDFVKQGAALADQVDAVRGRVANLDELVQKTQETTTGIVDEAAIVEGIALFDAFGLEISKLPELFEEASKTSLRTGESLETLISSAVTGVARMNPQILDNLGIQVKLSDATKKAAEMFGVQAKALDDTQKKAGMLSLVIEKLGTLNKDIELNESRVASIQRLEVSFSNLSHTVSKSFSEMFRTTQSRMDEFNRVGEKVLARSTQAWADMANRIKQSVRDIAASLRSAADAGLNSFQRQRIAWEEAGEKQLLVEKQLHHARIERAKLNTHLIKQGVMVLEQGKWRIFDTERLKQAEEDLRSRLEAKNKEELNALRIRMEMRREEAEAESARVAVVVEHMRDEIELAGGVLQETLDLRAAREAFNDAAESGNEEMITALKAQVIAAQEAEAVAKRRAKGRKTAIVDEKDKTEGILEQIRAQEHLNELAQLEGDLAKLFFSNLEKERLIKQEAAKIDDEVLRKRFEQAEMLALELETKQVLREIDKARLAIEREESDEEERQAKKRAREMEQTLDRFSGIAGGAFGEAAGMFSELDQSLASLGREERYSTIANGFAAISAQSNKIAKTTVQFATAVGKSNEEVAKGAAAALGALGPAVLGFVEGTKEKALIMMAFEAAMAVAEGAAGNIPAAVAHGIAAGMFGAMAGVAASQPRTAAPGAEVAGGGGLITPAGPSFTEREAQRVTVNLGPGMIMGLPQELGRAISEQISSMEGSGMEATAF